MSRTRSKTTLADLTSTGGGTFVCEVRYSTIEDQNNGQRRPISPCVQSSARYNPALVTAAPWIPGGQNGHVNIPASYLAETLRIVSSEKRSEHLSMAQIALNSKISSFSNDFSSLNFIYELREIGGLFKSIEKYRYIDWQFGISPMIADVKKALAHADAVAKSSKAKAFNNSHPFSFTRRSADLLQRTGTPFAGNPHSEDLSFHVTTRMRGTIRVGLPYLAGVNPNLYKVLDQLAIDPSASNAWEAVPWSWFVDWFIPIGNWLESLPSLMKPQCTFSGTVSHTVRGNAVFGSLYAGPGWSYAGGDFAGTSSMKFYERIPYTSAGALPLKFGLDSLTNPGKILIMRDILFPTKRG